MTLSQISEWEEAREPRQVGGYWVLPFLVIIEGSFWVTNVNGGNWAVTLDYLKDFGDLEAALVDAQHCPTRDDQPTEAEFAEWARSLQSAAAYALDYASRR